MLLVKDGAFTDIERHQRDVRDRARFFECSFSVSSCSLKSSSLTASPGSYAYVAARVQQRRRIAGKRVVRCRQTRAVTGGVNRRRWPTKAPTTTFRGMRQGITASAFPDRVRQASGDGCRAATSHRGRLTVRDEHYSPFTG